MHIKTERVTIALAQGDYPKMLHFVIYLGAIASKTTTCT